jgi:HSP20 family protein
MADVKVENQRGEAREGREGRELEQRRGGNLARRGERESWVNPFSLMRRLSEEMDRAFATSFGLPGGSRTGGGEEESLWMPPVEIRERDNNLQVVAELPGIDKDNVKVEVTNDGLVIQGHRRRETEDKGQGYWRTERSYGQFYRLVPLPDGIDPEKAKAEFKDGMLKVELPLPESMQRKRKEIPIKS